MNIPVYLVHYTPLKERLMNFEKLALALDFTNVEHITSFDGGLVKTSFFVSDQHRWDEQICNIRNLLLANVIHLSTQADYKSSILLAQNTTLNPEWLNFRKLDDGEISVLMKHLYALTSIAQGTAEHGLICEDDILLHPTTSILLNELIADLNPSISYIDLAGGCNLNPCESIDNINPSSNISLLGLNRTRTNAAYIVSKAFAKLCVSNFFPLCMPIDWHLQYIMTLDDSLDVYWAIKPIFVHGSETNVFQSWRSVGVQ